MSFTLNVTSSATTNGSDNERVIDWAAMNAHVVEVAGTQNKKRSLPAVISGIYDLGNQNRDDAEIDCTDKDWKSRNKDYDGSDESKRKIISTRAGSYFKEIDGKEHFCYPQKPVQQIAVAIDFPQIVVDKGQFFGKENPQPLRLLLNGEFSLSDGMRVVGRPYSIVEKKYDDGTWAFAKNNGIHKLAAACELLDAKGYFTKNRIGELVGKVAQFQFQVYMKEAKNGKKYYTEDIQLSGMIPEGITPPKFEDSLLHGTNLVGNNDPEAVKQLRACVKNTIKHANNYETSDIKALIEAGYNSTPTAKKDDEVKSPAAQTGNLADDLDDEDSLPF